LLGIAKTEGEIRALLAVPVTATVVLGFGFPRAVGAPEGGGQASLSSRALRMPPSPASSALDAARLEDRVDVGEWRYERASVSSFGPTNADT
jgi:hypothetical protein